MDVRWESSECKRQIKDLDGTVDLISQRVDHLDDRMAQKVDVPETDDHDDEIGLRVGYIRQHLDVLVQLAKKSNDHDD